MIKTIIDIVIAVIAFLFLFGVAISFLFILAVIGVTIKRRKEKDRLPWQCVLLGKDNEMGECICPDEDCIDCPVWMNWIERELCDGKQEQRGVSGSDSKRSDLPGRREPD